MINTRCEFWNLLNSVDCQYQIVSAETRGQTRGVNLGSESRGPRPRESLPPVSIIPLSVLLARLFLLMKSNYYYFLVVVLKSNY